MRNTELWWVLWGLREKHRTLVGSLGSTWETQNSGEFSGVNVRNTELWLVLWGLHEKHRTMVGSLWVDTRMEVVNTRWSSDGLGRLHLKGSRNLVTSVGLIPAQRDEKHYQLEGGWDHVWVYKYSDFLVSASLVPSVQFLITKLDGKKAWEWGWVEHTVVVFSNKNTNLVMTFRW